MTESFITLHTPDGPMDAFVADPGQGGPALLVIQEAFGVNDHIQDICRRLAAAGWLAVAPDLFHRSGKRLTYGYDEFQKIMPIFAALTNDALETDIRAALDWLRGRATRVGVVGFCMGGFSAFLAACRTDVDSAVCFYGGGIVHAREGLAMRPVLKEAVNMKCPVLLFFGGRDKSIPRDDVRTIEDALTRLDKKHEVVVYDDADHGFNCDRRASYHAPSAADAWRRTIDWFQKTLG